MAQQPLLGQVLLIVNGSRLRSIRHTTLGRTRVDVRRRYLYLTRHNTHKWQTSIPPPGFEPVVPASDWPQTHALGRSATEIGLSKGYSIQFLYFYPAKLNLRLLVSDSVQLTSYITMYNLCSSSAATVGITVLILLPGYMYTPDCCLGSDVHKITCLFAVQYFFKYIFVVIIYVKCLLSSELIDFDPIRQLESVAQKLPFITFRIYSVFPESRCIWEKSYVKTRMMRMSKANVTWLKHFQDTFQECIIVHVASQFSTCLALR